MSARRLDGWLVVDYAGAELTTIELGIGKDAADQWAPAFLDWVDGKRVAKVRHAGTGTTTVWLRVNGSVSRVGKITA